MVQIDTIRKQKDVGSLSYNALSVVMMHLVINKDCFFKANIAMLTEVRLVSMKTEKQHV